MKNIITILGLSLALSFGSFAGNKNPIPQLLEGEYGIDTDNNSSQVEKDIAVCEVGKPLYAKCTAYSGYRTSYYDYSQSKSWNSSNTYYPSEWVNECPEGESKISLNLFGAETYVRRQDIKECMNQKEYVYHYPVAKWVKDRLGFIYSYKQNAWLTPIEYIESFKLRREKSSSNLDSPINVKRPYPKDSCTARSNSNRIRRCVESGQYYQGDGELAGQMFYPDYLINKLSERGFSIKDIEIYETNLSSGNKSELKNNQNTVKKHSISNPSVIVNIKKDRAPSKSSINKYKALDTKDRIKKGQNSYIENLKEVKSLLDNGVINKQEFDTMKAKIIERM